MDEMTGIKKAEMKMTRSYSIDMIIILAACAAVGTTLYGARLLLTVFVSLATALLTETAASYIFRRSKPEMIGDLSDVVTGLIIALILPVSAPVWMAAAGSFFAVACIKLPFGDAVTTPFVPAAAGGAFLSLCFKEFFFTYPSVNIGNKYAMTGTSGFVSGTSVAQMLDASRSIGTTVIDVFDIFIAISIHLVFGNVFLRRHEAKCSTIDNYFIKHFLKIIQTIFNIKVAHQNILRIF